MAALMIQGCGSDVGKSVLVAGLCRLFANRGLSVRPFKPQNMSNNAAVTADGGEIGRAQALQAIACRVPPSVHMNPVLLKPQSDTGAQLIVRGRMEGTWKAAAYQDRKAALLDVVVESYRHLAAEADLVLVEGAGGAMSPMAEDATCLDLMAALRLPALVVGGSYLGAISHTLTAIETLRSRGLPVLAAVISESGDPDAPDFRETVASVAAFAGDLPVLAAPRGGIQSWPSLVI